MNVIMKQTNPELSRLNARLNNCNCEHFNISYISYSVLTIYYDIESTFSSVHSQMSRLMGKPTICIGENKDADQLRGNREADQRLCFRYSDSAIPLLLKSEVSSFYLFSVLVQAGLCQICSETTLLVFPRDSSNIQEFYKSCLFSSFSFDVFVFTLLGGLNSASVDTKVRFDGASASSTDFSICT